MQNGHVSGRINSQGRSHNHHVHGHQSNHGHKNRDLKLNINNAKASVDSSMMRSEEKERQRQEARAQRERSRATTSAPPEKNEALFAVVQVSPTPGHDRFQISDILGDFAELSRHHKSTDLIGVDHQPPTPAPAANSHLHDPDNYPTHPPYNAKGPDYNYSHRLHGPAVPPVGPRQNKHQAAGPHYKMPHQQNFTEEVKPTLKSGPGPGPLPGPGPGPGPGPVSRPFPDRGPPNAVVQSKGRPRSHERSVKDPQVMKIMSEMSDLKSPLSAILQTPRPDHQSSFTFPAPALPTPIKDSSSGFRHPNELHIKSVKPPENRLSSIVPSKSSSVNDDFQLSEESDEEVDGSLATRSKSENVLKTEDTLNEVPIISPLKNTDESSNSDESSGSDTDSSSSEGEGRQSPAPTSPTPSDKNPWSLSNIFQQSTNKEEVHEVGIKGNNDPVYDVRPEPMPPSPHTVDEPAPPVVTTVPEVNPNQGSQLIGFRSLRLSSTDESSDNELPPTLTTRGKKPVGSRSSSNRSAKISPKVKKVVELALSSESEDEAPPRYSKLASKSGTQSLSKSPRGNSLLTSRHHQPVTRKPPRRKKDQPERKSIEGANCTSDSDGNASIATPSTERNFSKKSAAASSSTSSAKPQVQPTKSNIKLTNEENLPSVPFGRSPKKANLPPSAPSVNAPEERRKSSRREPKYNGEIKSDVGSDNKIDNKIAKTLAVVHTKAEAVDVQKKMKKEKEEEAKLEKKKRRRSRHQSEVDGRERKNPREVTETEVSRPMEDEREKLSPVTRKPCTQINNNSINNVNSINVSLPNTSLLQYENGVPRLFCYIPLNLIDKLPTNNVESSVKDEKLNKEVLEMRTSGGKGKDKSRNINKSPINEDENKVRAIYSIYKKRQSSLEPDKIKRDVKIEAMEAQDVKSPLTLTPKLDEPTVVKPAQMKEDPKSLNTTLETERGPELALASASASASVSASGSAPSLPTPSTTKTSSESHSHSKKHKKDKRKERSVSSIKDKGLEPELTKRKRREASPEPDITQKRSREDSRESTRGGSKSSSVSQHTSKKQKTAHNDENNVLSPRETVRASRLSSPHPRTSQRNVSEERPTSALANEPALAPYQPRPKQLQAASSQFPQKGPLVNSPYLDNESEEDLGIGDGAQRGGHSFSSARDKLVEESHGTNGGDTSEYHSLPSSEHGSSTYRPGEDHSSPLGSLGVAPQLLECDQMYPPDINPSPGPSMEYNGSLPQHPEVIPNPTPIYISYFERQIPEILKDNTQYLNTAKELKHLADKERHRVMQTIMYLEAVLYFILTGESMESDTTTWGPSFTMYNDTFKLIRHVASPIHKGLKEGPPNKLNVILTILSLRCQSLLALKLVSMKRNEMKEVNRILGDFLKINFIQGVGRQPASLPVSTPSGSSTGAGGGTPSGGVWGGSQRSAANNSPSSLSPTPSPAGSVGSEGSQSSSGYSTEGTRQRGQPPPMGTTPPQGTPLLTVPPDVHAMMMKHCHWAYTLNSSHEMWLESDDLVYRHHMKEFFIELDRSMGPLTLHSSLRELVRYVQTALDKLKKLVNVNNKDANYR